MKRKRGCDLNFCLEQLYLMGYRSLMVEGGAEVIQTFLDGMKRRFPVADGDVRIAGCLIEIDAASGLARAFERIEILATC